MIDRTSQPLTWTEYQKTVETLEFHGRLKDAALFVLGCNVGLRIGDLAQITWNDVLHSHSKTIKEGKTGKKRTVTFNQPLREKLSYYAAQLKVNKKQPVLANKQGKPLSRQYVNAQLKRLQSKYAIVPSKQLSTHSLRKTFGRRVYDVIEDKGHALTMLSEILNHSSTKVTRIYLGIQAQEIANVYSLIA